MSSIQTGYKELSPEQLERLQQDIKIIKNSYRKENVCENTYENPPVNAVISNSPCMSSAILTNLLTSDELFCMYFSIGCQRRTDLLVSNRRNIRLKLAPVYVCVSFCIG